jgi:putative sterol carrier protein
VRDHPKGGTDDFLLMIAHGRARVSRGAGNELPIVTMTIDDVDFLRLITGALDPMHAYFAGRIELAGDIMFAAKVGGLFRMPTARPDPYE